MLTMKKFHDDDFTSKIYSEVADYREGYASLDDVLNNLNLRYNLYCDFINSYIGEYIYEEQLKHKIRQNKVDLKALREHFDFDALVEIISHTKQFMPCNLSEKLPKVYPELGLLFAMLNTTWQWYSEKDNSVISHDIFKKLINLKTPFDDHRFEAFPTHVSEYNKKGKDSCILLKDKTGSFVSYHDEETDTMKKKRADSGYRSNFLDAKLAIIIYFKNKPSITVSFNYDTSNNIYIHQIQCQPKDRGHYKIKGDWKLAAIQYLSEIFPEYNMHLIDGKTLSDMIYKGYSEVPEHLKPSTDVFNKIPSLYDNLLPNFDKWFEKSGIKYRTLYST